MLTPESSSGVRVLFTGQYWPGANTLYIARAFERCGAIVRILNDSAIYPDWRESKSRLARRLLRRPVIEAEWNCQLRRLVDGFAPDLVYVTNADYCWPETIAAIRSAGIPVMCFYHDPQWKDREGTRFSENLPHFNLVATTRAWHEDEFRSGGAAAVAVVRFGYEPTVHRPLLINSRTLDRYGCDVTFVGTCETHRSKDLTSLVTEDFSYSFKIWGGLWDRLDSTSPLLRYWQRRDVHESEVPVVYASTKVALHWINREEGGTDAALRKGDQHNSRTFQIAACGGALMMAQRTEEHLHFFVEDEEAVYFDNVPELREKLRYWLDPARDEQRQAVAQAARARCQAEDYTYVPVVRSFLEFFGLSTCPPLREPNRAENIEVC